MNTEATDLRRDLEMRLIQKAWKDPEFKQQVVSNPKEMFEQYLGRKLPLELKIVIHEEDENTLHFSIPPAPPNTTELSDEELERVSGGTEVWFTVTILGSVAAITGAGVGSAIGTAAASTVSQHGW